MKLTYVGIYCIGKRCLLLLLLPPAIHVDRQENFSKSVQIEIFCSVKLGKYLVLTIVPCWRLLGPLPIIS